MKKYRMKNCSKRFLEAHGFSYNREFSNDDETFYSLFFPVCKWLEYTTLRAEIRVLIQTREVWIDVYDGSTNRTRYAPFYYNEFGDYSPIINSVNEIINQKKEELCIEEVKRNYGSRNKNQVFQRQGWNNNRTYSKNNSRRLDRPQSSRERKPKSE